jgi:hypothetical protein
MVGASGRATACAASVAAVEPTPIFAALVTPRVGGTTHDGRGEQRRTVPEILREMRAEQDPAGTPHPRPPRGRVGHVPGVLSFRPR